MHSDPNARLICGTVLMLISLFLPATYNEHWFSFVVGVPMGLLGLGVFATAWGDQSPDKRR
jgi:hypothetical protein